MPARNAIDAGILVPNIPREETAVPVDAVVVGVCTVSIYEIYFQDKRNCAEKTMKDQSATKQGKLIIKSKFAIMNKVYQGRRIF
jgi:hypothetical protein